MAHNGEQWKVIGDQESEGLYHLCEAQAAYNSDFTPEKDGLRAVGSNNKCNVNL